MLPKILILDVRNGLVPLTVNSIKMNMPDAKYVVVDSGVSKIGTALKNCDDVTLVVKSGLVLNISDKDIPNIDRIKKYHMVCSRDAVFIDNKKWRHQYDQIGKPANAGVMDLSIFMINPEKFDFIPESDSGIMKNLEIGYMPRYMNHKNDVLINKAINAKHLVKYSILGDTAAVLNYLPNIMSGKATVPETFGLCFDKLEPYVDGLNDKYRENILKLSRLTKKRIGNLRKLKESMHSINKK